MKKFIYIFVDIVFFNLSVCLLYYLGLINNTNLIIFGNWFDIVFSNIVVLLFLLVKMHIGIFLFFLLVFLYLLKGILKILMQ